MAIGARPGFFAVLISALAPVVGVLHLRESKILFPVRLFFLQRSRAVTDLYPPHRPIGTESRVLHIAQIFAFGDRALSDCLASNCLEEATFTTGFKAGSD